MTVFTAVLSMLLVAALAVAPSTPSVPSPPSAPAPSTPTETPTPTPTPTETPTPTPAPVESDPRADAPDAAPDAAPAAAGAADRIGGVDRYATAVAVSQQTFPAGAPIVFLASGLDYPDALSAAPLAAALGGPLLLTPTAALPPAGVAELQRLAPAEVVIVGGPAIISDSVEQQVRALGLTTRRVFGTDRYATSRALIAAFAPASDLLYVATGRTYPDALAAAAAAGAAAAPVLLVDGAAATLDAPTAALIAARGVRTAVIAGGVGAVSIGIELDLDARVDAVRRLAGLDRYGTAVAIAGQAPPEADRAFVATGAGYADALAGAVLAAVEGAPLYLSGPACLPRAVREAIVVERAVERVTLLGGSGVLGERVAALAPCTTVEDDRATSNAELLAALQLRLRSLPGTYAVSVRELGGVETAVSINGSVMQEPASVMKLFVAYAVLDRVDAGTLTLATPTRSGTTVGACLRVIIHVSDNDCHWDLVALVGNQALNNQFWAEGYTGTVYQGVSGNGITYASKHTSANDVTLLLTRLHRGELLSPASTALFIDLLETQVWRHRLPSGMPPGVPIANKTGYLWVSSGYIHADVAIVSAPTGPFVVSVIGSRNATAAGVRAIGTVVYEHFAGPVTTAASFSPENLVLTSTVPFYSGPGTGQLGVASAGTRVAAYASQREWYQVIRNGQYVYIHASALRNVIDYPRSVR